MSDYDHDKDSDTAIERSLRAQIAQLRADLAAANELADIRLQGIRAIEQERDAANERERKKDELLSSTLELIKREVPIMPCDHEVGVCWCEWNRAIEKIESAILTSAGKGEHDVQN